MGWRWDFEGYGSRVGILGTGVRRVRIEIEPVGASCYLVLRDGTLVPSGAPCPFLFVLLGVLCCVVEPGVGASL